MSLSRVDQADQLLMDNKGKPKMVFTANDNGDYICDDYKICWGTRGFSLWNHQKSPSCLGRELTVSEAIALAELDALQA